MTRALRHHGPDLDALTPEQETVAAAIRSGPRGAVVGPLRVWLTNPHLADRAQALGRYARYGSVLPPYLSELAILVTARYWSSGFEWAQHAQPAQDAGHTSATLDAIAAARWPDLADAAAQAVLAFTIELHRDKRVSDQVYAAAEATLGTAGCVDLVAICGYYTLISMTINAFDLPDGAGPVLPTLDVAPDRMFAPSGPA